MRHRIVADPMTPTAVSVVPGTTFKEIARLLDEFDTAGALVSSPAVVARPEWSVVRAARVMDRARVTRLPVVDGGGHLVGVLSRSDLVQLFLRRDRAIQEEIVEDVVANTLGAEPVCPVSGGRGQPGHPQWHGPPPQPRSGASQTLQQRRWCRGGRRPAYVPRRRPDEGVTIMDTPSAPHAPVAVTAELDTPLSRWLWLVKWVLVVPHWIVLCFLWIAFFVVTVIAFFAILFTERFPRGLFDFNLGVLRWSWRVSYYSYGALGTDRYPPFSLGPEPDYPARLDIVYPERLSRSSVLVKWWLLAIPHYLVIAFFTSGMHAGWWSGGLITLLALIAAFALAFTERYPRDLFVLIVGLNRWVLRVAAYASLMTDAYPPFRLDQGGTETAGTERARDGG